MLKRIIFSIINLIFIFSLISVGFSLPALAQSSGSLPTKDQICGGPCPLVDAEFGSLNQTGLFAFILSIARFLTYIGVGVAVLWLVLTGFQFIIGQRDAAKKNIIAILTGLVVIIVAYTVVNILVSLLQSNTLGGIFGSGTTNTNF